MPAWEATFDLRVNLDDPALIGQMAAATAIATVIRGFPLRPSVRKRLNNLNVLRAVHSTTAIEGNDLDEDEVRRALLASPGQRALPLSQAREESEVRNAERVMRFVATTLDAEPDRPLSGGLIRTLHRLMTEGIDYPHNEPGAYRSHAVSVGTFVPPREGAEVRRLMDAFETWLNTPPVKVWPPVARAIAAHFYFVSIHPFGDGNGRTARAIESYLLYQAGVNVLGFYSLANYYYRNRDDYIAHLNHCREAGDLTPFIRFAVAGLVEELDSVRKEVATDVSLTAFRESARDQILLEERLNAPVRARLMLLLGSLDDVELDEDRLLSGRDPRAWLWKNVSRRTAMRDLERLEAMGLIAREAGVIRPRLDIVDRFPD